MKESILFVTCAGQRQGMGHWTRCLALADELKRQQNHLRISFLVETDLEIRTERYPVETVGLGRRHKALLSALKNVKWPVHVVLDLREDYKALRMVLRGRGCLVVIDEDRKRSTGEDLVITPTFLSKKHILLRRQFSRMGLRKKQPVSGAKQALVCFGGTDPNGLTERVCDLLVSKKTRFNGRFVVVTAKGRSPHWTKRYPRRVFSFKTNVKDMASLLRKSRFAIISGGTLLYESCAVGCPAIVVSQNGAQENEAGVLAKMGGAIDLGHFRRLRPARLEQAVNRLAVDDIYAVQIAKSAQKQVDGSGCRRVASAILKRLRSVAT